MIEADFADEVLRYFNTIGCWSWQIKDEQVSKPGADSFVSKKPFDIIGVSMGIPMALELKLSKSPTFQINHIKDHQAKALRAFELAGGIGLLVVNFRLSRGKCPANKTFAVRSEFIGGDIDHALCATKGSWSLSMMSTFVKDHGSYETAFEIPRMLTVQRIGGPTMLSWDFGHIARHEYARRRQECPE